MGVVSRQKGHPDAWLFVRDICLSVPFGELTLSRFRHAKRTVENTAAADVTLDEAEVQEVWDIINSVDIKGDRYYGTDAKTAHLWG